MIRWWPPIAVTAMVILGLAVGKNAIPIDEWFLQFRDGPGQWLLHFSDTGLLAFVMGATVAVPLSRRQWRLTSVAVLSPVVAWVSAQLLKRLFDRQKEGYLAYPSGHATVAVVIWGMVVLVAGAAAWSVIVAVMFSLLAMLGQAFVWHYVTDTIGGALLGTAIVCVGALIARRKLTGVNPGAIYVTQGG